MEKESGVPAPKIVKAIVKSGAATLCYLEVIAIASIIFMVDNFKGFSNSIILRLRAKYIKGEYTMIGLDIRVKNEYDNYLYKIFYGINFLNYVWQINADDFLFSENGDLKENLFGTNVLSGEAFLKCISIDSYYMIFVDIKAYPIVKECIKIETFDDF